MKKVTPRKSVKAASRERDAIRKAASRAIVALAGAYTGAATGRRQTTQWITRGGDPASDILYDLPSLRNRSRDLIRNSPLATGAIGTAISNVVGTGLKLQSRINRSILDLDDEQAEEWQDRTEAEFALWAESKDCDKLRTLNFYEMQALVFRQTLENGDVFTLTPRIPERVPYSLCLQLVEGDQVCNEKGASDSLTLSGGIEKDDNGAPSIYHIRKVHPGNSLAGNNREWVKISAYGQTGLKNVIHLFDVKRPGQPRGVPFLAPVIEPLKMLDKYMEAELMATVVSAMLTVFIKSDSGNTDLAPMGPVAETQGKTTDEDYKLGSGAILSLATGESIDTVDPKRPNQGFDDFVVAILRQIGSALEIPFEILIKHFTSSYSASRAALLEAWRFFKQRRAWLARNFCQEVYRIWLYEAVALGRVSAPGFFNDPLLRKAYEGAVWIGDAPGQIDPVKETTAAEKRIELGLSTVDEETVMVTGGDFESNYPRIVKEIKMFKEAGMKHPAVEGAKPEPLNPDKKKEVEPDKEEPEKDKEDEEEKENENT